MDRVLVFVLLILFCTFIALTSNPSSDHRESASTMGKPEASKKAAEEPSSSQLKDSRKDSSTFGSSTADQEADNVERVDSSHQYMPIPDTHRPIHRKATLLQALLEQHKASCDPTANHSEGPATRLWHVESLQCGWDRFWIQTSRCSGGDQFDVIVQEVGQDAERLRLSIDRVIDLENGLYEVVLYVPPYRDRLDDRDRRLSVCVDLTMSGLPFSSHFPLTASSMRSVQNLRDPHKSDSVSKTLKNNSACLPKNMQCVNQSKWECPEQVGLYEGSRLPLCNITSQLVPGHWRGEWYHPRACRLKNYTRKETEQCLHNKWLLGWGDSTMKQALSNFLEYHLNFSVIPNIFMESYNREKTLNRMEKIRTGQYRNARRTRNWLPNFHSYRQWDRRVERSDFSARISMVWGGCTGSVHSSPHACYNKSMTGMRNRQKMTLLFEAATIQGERLPDFILMSHHLWLPHPFGPIWSEASLIDLYRETIGWLRGLYKKVGQPLPILLWNSAPKLSNEGEYNRCRQPTETTAQHISWSMAAQHEPDVVFIDRYSLYYPFHHHEDGFVHLGWHYGSTWGMCLTGISYRRFLYDPIQGPGGGCAKITYPEAVVTQTWLNMICQDKRR